MGKKCLVSVVVAAEGGHFEGQCSRTDVDNRFNDRVAVVRTGSGATKGLTVMVQRDQVRVVRPATSAMNGGAA